jgi:hypothetical protein
VTWVSETAAAVPLAWVLGVGGGAAAPMEACAQWVKLSEVVSDVSSVRHDTKRENVPRVCYGRGTWLSPCPRVIHPDDSEVVAPCIPRYARGYRDT